MKVVIYGSAQLGVQIAWHLSLENEILCFIDSDCRKHSVNGYYLTIDEKQYSIYGPEKLRELEFDKIFIASEVPLYIEQIKETLKKNGVNEDKFDTSLTFIRHYARINFMKTLTLQFKENNTKGAVAELGVFRGDFAKYINHTFKEDEFFLLDTFEGFDKRDCKAENQNNFSKANGGDFSSTSLELVKSKMPFAEKCHFIKGYFPETAIAIPQDTQFKFVNLDVDLYQPILSGLEFFYPRLSGGGVILIDDYFHPYYTGVKKAVDEWCSKQNLKPIPMGDGFSIILIKT